MVRFHGTAMVPAMRRCSPSLSPLAPSRKVAAASARPDGQLAKGSAFDCVDVSRRALKKALAGKNWLCSNSLNMIAAVGAVPTRIRRVKSGIESRLREQLIRSAASLASDHDDLISETLMDLAIWMRSHPSANEEAVAVTILRRRIADRFRLRSLEPLGRTADAALAETPTDAPSADRATLIGELLEVTLEELQKLTARDRDLIALAAESLATRLTVNERQRLHRARRKLGAAIIERLGDSARELLRPEFGDDA